MGNRDFDNDPLDRLIERAVRERRDEPPEALASQTAAFVESAVRRNSDRLESWLERGLIAALIIAAGGALSAMSSPALSALASSAGAGWFYSGILCVGLSAALHKLSSGAGRWIP